MSERMRSANAAPDVVDSQGMSYLDSLPRRIVTVYLPLGVFLIVLLFPFYWMVDHDVQAERRSCCRARAIRSG